MVDKSDFRLFVFVFHVHRTVKATWYQFWLRNSAEVHAYVYAPSLEGARAVVREEMSRKGFQIVTYTTANELSAAQYPPENKRLIEFAITYGAHFRYFGLPDRKFGDQENDTVSGEITSRYGDVEGVTIDQGTIPQELHCLIPYAKIWAIGDDVERSEFLNTTSENDKIDFYNAVKPRVESIESFCDQRRNDVPVPDEVILFDMMLEAFAEISPEFQTIE